MKKLDKIITILEEKYNKKVYQVDSESHEPGYSLKRTDGSHIMTLSYNLIASMEIEDITNQLSNIC